MFLTITSLFLRGRVAWPLATSPGTRLSRNSSSRYQTSGTCTLFLLFECEYSYVRTHMCVQLIYTCVLYPDLEIPFHSYCILCRRLCILKGIYPHEPKSFKKVNKGSTAYRTYYYTKDIQYLAHEPLLGKFRDFKSFMKKVKKAYHKEQESTVQKLYENKPIYTLDHIVKERYVGCVTISPYHMFVTV